MKKVLGLVSLLTVSCTTPERADKEFTLRSPVKITLQERDKIKSYYEDKYHKSAIGYASPNMREIVVPYSNDKDVNGNWLPDMCVLGLEVWHMKELGYYYHK